MTLPTWAAHALDTFKPLPPHGASEPNAERLAAWEALRDRLVHRWHEVGGNGWRVPLYARQAILETAVACALEYLQGKTPARAAQGLHELDRLNESITTAAAQLADLVAQHQALRESEGLDDWGDDAADPLDLWAWLAALDVPTPAALARVQHGHTTSRPVPGLVELLQALAQRHARPAAPLWTVDRRETFGRKTAGWAPLARRLFASLDRSRGGNGINLLDCLTPDQLAALLCVTLNAPPEAFTTDAIKALRSRYRQELTKR